ncbi:hypothetical protein L210DRAFT_3510473 [Boletus edulis BED1]|uniref:Uncharacterized protein n=1 Tax=Boletus edulis BED1 TaxID=1328754 RepID=A0AAD4G6W2_BOLED|nr:hypothetical protein L210DRAFT_3510473 [Boletus edulis BED1]
MALHTVASCSNTELNNTLEWRNAQSYGDARLGGMEELELVVLSPLSECLSLKAQLEWDRTLSRAPAYEDAGTASLQHKPPDSFEQDQLRLRSSLDNDLLPLCQIRGMLDNGRVRVFQERKVWVANGAIPGHPKTTWEQQAFGHKTYEKAMGMR